ncbi:uncharacterized protein LOC106867262 isoform X1 [Octopus bimaculoides]|uniref:uncharacterized protein LOC106867262 isoform X1 n=1 Tax=Octopus bimaculoides TaxID=37653 RepID=UPI0022E2ED7E|nr:uncharacterized protein LOC106867262 isoform X1 [Octopus bimaculoides]
MEDSSIEIARRNARLKTCTIKNHKSVRKLSDRHINIYNKNHLFWNFSKLSVDSLQTSDRSHLKQSHPQQEGVVDNNSLSDFSEENVSCASNFCINSTPVENGKNICIENISLSPIGLKEVSINQQNIRFASPGLCKRNQVSCNVSKKQNKKEKHLSSKKEISEKENNPLLTAKQYNSRTCRIRKIDGDDGGTAIGNCFNIRRSEESSSKATQQKNAGNVSFASKYKLKSSLKNCNAKALTTSKSVRFNDKVITLMDSLNDELIISEESLDSFGNGNSIGRNRNSSGTSTKLNRENHDVTNPKNKVEGKFWRKSGYYFSHGILSKMKY